MFTGKMKELSDKYLPGRIKVEEYPAGQLYAIKDAIKATMAGAVEMCITGDAYIGVDVPNTMIARIPALPKNPAQIQDFWVNYGEQFSEKYLYDTWKIGLVGAYPVDATTWWFKKSFASLADIKGRKVGHTAAPEDKMLSEDAYGLAVAVIDMGDRLTALQTGLIDASQTAFTTHYNYALQKQAPYYLSTDVACKGCEYFMLYNYPWFKNLPPDVSKALHDVIWPGATEAAYATQTKFAVDVVQKIKADGATECKLKPEETANLLNVVYPKIQAKYLNLVNDWELKIFNEIGKKYTVGASYELKK